MLPAENGVPKTQLQSVPGALRLSSAMDILEEKSVELMQLSLHDPRHRSARILGCPKCMTRLGLGGPAIL